LKQLHQLSHTLKILIVEDDPGMRSFVRALLKKVGLEQIAEAADGEEALREFRQDGADLIFLDVNMAPMDGLEFLKAVRAGEAGRQSYPDIEIVAVPDVPDARPARRMCRRQGISLPSGLEGAR